MSDEKKPSPVDDLKQGLGLLFRAAKGAAQHMPTGKLEDVARDAVKEVGRAFESLGQELDRALGRTPDASRTESSEPEPSERPTGTTESSAPSSSSEATDEPPSKNAP